MQPGRNLRLVFDPENVTFFISPEQKIYGKGCYSYRLEYCVFPLENCHHLITQQYNIDARTNDMCWIRADVCRQDGAITKLSHIKDARVGGGGGGGGNLESTI